MRSFFVYWDAISIPPKPQQTDVSTALRERQAYFVSRTLLLFMLADVITSVIKLIDPGPFHIVVVPLISLLINLFAVACNRLRLFTLAGTCVMVETVGTIFVVIAVHIPLRETDLPLFCLLGVSEVVAGLLLPPLMIFAVAALNSLLIVFSLYIFPLSEPLGQSLSHYPAGIFFPLLALIIEVGAGTYLLVISLSKEVHRASYAEKAASLQAQLAADRQQLKDGVEHFAQILTQASRGNFSARVSPRQGTILWEIAVPLNNLLKQVQFWRHEASRYQELERAVVEITQYIKHVENHPDGAMPPLSGSSADGVILALREMRQKVLGEAKQKDPREKLG